MSRRAKTFQALFSDPLCRNIVLLDTLFDSRILSQSQEEKKAVVLEVILTNRLLETPSDFYEWFHNELSTMCSMNTSDSPELFKCAERLAKYNPVFFILIDGRNLEDTEEILDSIALFMKLNKGVLEEFQELFLGHKTVVHTFLILNSTARIERFPWFLWADGVIAPDKDT